MLKKEGVADLHASIGSCGKGDLSVAVRCRRGGRRTSVAL